MASRLRTEAVARQPWQTESFREYAPWLDTGGPVRPLLVAVFGWVAEQERSRLIERTKAGLERARRQGKRLGRPRLSPVKLAAAAADVEAGMAQRAAARNRGISEAALRAYLKQMRAGPHPAVEL
ncbi:recombinase family protein [Anaeromyxobacter soli]|uniref:recombinase family protein n=1 Tax=Anaeromyxobacter soli TaxID=2922725 RepID=UPI0024345738|nr:recombinase family protein [Anaeromyxobacter sp. SG29]